MEVIEILVASVAVRVCFFLLHHGIYELRHPSEDLLLGLFSFLVGIGLSAGLAIVAVKRIKPLFRKRSSI